MRTFAASLGLALALSLAARADPRLDETVYDPYVEPGVLEVAARSAGLIDAATKDEQAAEVFELEYGVRKDLSLAVFGATAQAPHEGTRWKKLGLEAIWSLGRIPKIGVDTALYFEVAHGLGGEPDSVEGKLLLAKQAGRFEGLLNLIVERPLNAPGGDYASYGYAASATWRTVGALRLGAEMIGNLGSDHAFGGRQGAWLGPQVKWAFRPLGGGRADLDDDGDEVLAAPAGRHLWEVQVDVGWLSAIGPAHSEAASQGRIAVELERGF